MTLENVLNIHDKEQPEGVILQLGGQTPLNLARGLEEAGVKYEPGRGIKVNDKLQTSNQSIFAAGDVRHGVIRRVASAVGQGAVAVSLIHKYLETV